MQPYPHIYTVQASGMATGSVPISATRLPTLETGPPAEFDGPGDLWSPESLLVAAIADCFILTFRGVSRAAALPWQQLQCEVDGTLERVAGVTQFTRYTTRATLTLAAGADHAKFHALLERAENVCLVANSLRGERTLEVRLIETAAT
jgi:organic hydroperoxide reductase OsmC/OhrA